MKAIPVPLRERILKLYEQGKSTAELAVFSGYCVAAVRRVRQHFKARGTVKPQTHLCGQDPADRPTQGATAKTGGRSAGGHAGGTGHPSGSPVRDLDDGFMAAAAGVEL